MEEPTPPPRPVLLPRVIVLAVVAALAQFWASRHLGLGSDTPWIAGVIALLTVVDRIIGRLDKGTKDTLESLGRRMFQPLLVGWVPMLLGAAAVVAALWVSSVTVIPANDVTAAKSSVRARLLRLDGVVVDTESLGPGSTPARFTGVFTSPFGRAYRLAVDGYLEETITVRPLLGVQVTPDRDLRRSPTVLFRPPTEGVQSLGSGGRFVVTWQPPGESPKYLVSPQHARHRGALLVGRAQPIPSASATAWRLELTAAGVTEPRLSEMLLLWSAPRAIEPSLALAPGMRVVGEVCSRADKLVARAEVVLGTDAFVDVPMLPVTGGEACR